jgi:hypothetical protein
MEKRYIKGSARGVKFSNGGDAVNCSILVSDLEPNERGYANFVVASRREPDNYGNTHSVYHDDFVPKPKEEVVEEPQAAADFMERSDESPTPF